MRLVTFRYQGRDAVGALVAGQLLDISRAYAAHLCSAGIPHGDVLARAQLPEEMLGFLAAGERSLVAAGRALEAVSGMVGRGEAPIGIRGEPLLLSLDQVRLLAPVPRPGKIICIGLNYRDHAEEVGLTLPERPTIFTKFSTSVVGPGDPVVLSPITAQVDYEVELAVVIGKTARAVREEQALDYVAGYTVLNDVSARDLQLQQGGGQWVWGKSLDSFCPMGPVLVTRDELPDPGNLMVSLRLNGETMQSSNTANLVFGVSQLVSFLSQAITLEPGDVIA
ncbi:MAG TPA: fumarylacetoacetate hydrolase family protein, partial [Chloroflexota bacterium]|nr:fumarylacetoacetate hydrolase family protein [Chloroflexota bacterium]